MDFEYAHFKNAQLVKQSGASMDAAMRIRISIGLARDKNLMTGRNLSHKVAQTLLHRVTRDGDN